MAEISRNFRVVCAPTGDYPNGREWVITASTAGAAQERACMDNNLTWSHVHAGLISTTELTENTPATELEHGGRCGVRSPWHSGCIRFADECDGVTHWDIPGQPEQVWMTPSAAERAELERHRFSFEGATALLAAHLLDDHGANLLAVAPWRNGLSRGDWVALDSLHLQAHLRGA